jgi:outer membrane protein OmpA-like peptidoglycan-associated protein
MAETIVTAGPPTISISSPINGQTVTRLEVVRAGYGCQDAAGAPGIAECAGTVANGSPIDTSTLGSHVFTVGTVSNDGQIAVETIHYTVVDTTPAAPTITGSPDPETDATRATLRFEVDPGALAECSVDRSRFAVCVSPVKLSRLALGRHTFSVRQIDAAGAASAAARLNWLIELHFRPGGTGSNPQKVRPLVDDELATGDGRPAAVGCRMIRGSLRLCTVEAYAAATQPSTAAVDLIGSGQASYTERGHDRAVVDVRLNALGSRLLKSHPFGLKVKFRIAAKPFDTADIATAMATTALHPLKLLLIPSAGIYDGASATLSPTAHPFVTAVAKIVLGAKRIQCQGYTDNTLTTGAAELLGIERARTLCQAIHAAGSAVPWTAVSFGSSRPRATNATAAGRALNRRVEIQVWF